MEWDSGPSSAIKKIFETAPLDEYKNIPARFRLEWGPIYYRGRLNNTARVLVIGQDPAADENVARRILVGDAGQRVQGFLRKLGIAKSYVMINATLYSIYGQFDNEIETFADIPAVAQWRNSLLNALLTSKIKAVLAFGKAARHVVDTYPGIDTIKNQGRLFYLLHPTARPESAVLQDWSSKLQDIGAKVPAESGQTKDLTAYPGTTFRPEDLVRIPLRDVSFGTPAWMGTGDCAVRLNKNRTVPPDFAPKSAIVWGALDKEG